MRSVGFEEAVNIITLRRSSASARRWLTIRAIINLQDGHTTDEPYKDLGRRRAMDSQRCLSSSSLHKVTINTLKTDMDTMGMITGTRKIMVVMADTRT